MNEPVQIREYVRQVLSASPRPLAESVIFSHVKRMARDPLTVDELKAALQWNLSRDFVEAAKNDDTDQEEWSLTAKGRKKEGF